MHCLHTGFRLSIHLACNETEWFTLFFVFLYCCVQQPAYCFVFALSCVQHVLLCVLSCGLVLACLQGFWVEADEALEVEGC